MAYTGTSASGKSYNIGSTKGLDFVNNAAAGATLTGGDGSTWTKNADGTTTISKNGETYTVGQAKTNNYFPTSNGQGSVPGGYYTQNANVVSGTVRAPNGDTLNMHDWSTDKTDYSKLMANAKTDAEFLKYAQERVNKANAQGIDISGNGSARSNADLYNAWYEKTGKSQPQSFGADQTLGYYGMDGSGHWGYYADQGLTQKLPNGGWDSYKASDGGYALFDSKNGYLWPSSVRDESRAGKTVTLAAGSKAFEVRYNANGYPVSVTNLNQTRGVNGNDLNLPTARSLNDQGISDRDLLLQTSGVGYTGPGSGVSFDDVKGATRDDYNAVLSGRGGSAGNTGGYGAGGATESGASGSAGGSVSGYDGGSGGNETPALSGDALAAELRELYRGSDSLYAQALAAQRAAIDAAVRKTTSALEAQKASTNESYSNLFRQLYLNKMRNRQNLEQRLAAQGVTGGAAESTALGYDTQYEDALRQGELSRIDAIGGLDRAIEDARLTGDISNAQAAAESAREQANRYASVLQSLISRYDTLAARREAYAREDAQRAEAYAREDARRAETYANEYAASNRSYAYKTATQLLQSGYMPTASLLDAAGIDAASAQAMVAAVQAERTAEAERAAAAASKPLLTAAQVNAAIKAGNLTPNVLSAYEYYYGVPYGGR